MLTFTTAEIETRRRIKISVWAYAYELQATSIVPDHIFDMECAIIDLNVRTSRPDLDFWFICNFVPYTGQWIHKHPELHGIERIYNEFYKSA